VSGLPEARDAVEILAQLGDVIDLILDGGPAGGGPPSTVVDCTRASPVVVREGAIAVARVAEVLRVAGLDLGAR
jgi:tRNA A37 threonylcarbamoyladenosine synthetase subunit TsaC/SUA5/YrdC